MIANIFLKRQLSPGKKKKLLQKLTKNVIVCENGGILTFTFFPFAVVDLNVWTKFNHECVKEQF